MDCELCFETFNQIDHLPKVLQYCGHTFCQQCLSYLDSFKDSLECPLCRYKIAKGSQQPPTNFALLQAIKTIENEREGKGLSRHLKPRFVPFGCTRWEDLKDFVKREHAPYYLKLIAVHDGGETVYTECSKSDFDKYKFK